MSSVDSEKLNAFLAHIPHTPFTQSYEWGQFQLQTGKEVFTLGIQLEDELIGSIMLLVERVGRWYKRVYSPLGPVLGPEVLQSKNFLLLWEKTIKEMIFAARQLRVASIRFEPNFISLEPLQVKFPSGLDPLMRIQGIQPQVTRIIDLSLSEEQLLARMHSKTRYNIRIAEKRGIEVNCDIRIDVQEFDDFYRVLNETAHRHGLRMHSHDYYEMLCRVLSVRDAETIGNPERCFARLITARYQGKVIAANILIFFGDTVTYVHGGSSDEYKNVMAPYLLQWEGMREAQRLGYRYYDLWGCMPESSHGMHEMILKQVEKWKGVDRFKKGFGGEVYYYPGAFELILDKKKYTVYRLLKRVKGFLRV